MLDSNHFAMPFLAVQVLLRNSNIKTTMRYAHLGENSLKMAVKFLESEPNLALVN